MRIAVVGAGPVGSLCGLMLARRGHDVLLIDRDAGPPGGADWQRRGVMQFDLPHFFRWMVRDVICAEVPELWTALLLAGGVPALPPGAPEMVTGLACRRRVFERTLWEFVSTEPGIRRFCGRADKLVTDHDRVVGLLLDGQQVPADLVLVATGRAGRLGDELRAPGESSSCGFSYAARHYRALRSADVPDWGVPHRSVYHGYEAMVFPQDGPTLNALIVRPTSDSRLNDLRHNEIFEAAAAAIPQLAPWTDPAGFEAITDVLAGSNLMNAYRGQRGSDGGVTAGVIFVGDSVCTTNPAAGRGAGLGLQQAHALVGFLDAEEDLASVAAAFDDWCTEHIRPWYEDHVYWDATELRRFAGEDLDLEARIPSDVVCECAQVDPSIMSAALPYFGMLAGPGVLDSVQDAARAVLRTGWRPPYAEGPTREDLVRLTTSVAI